MSISTSLKPHNSSVGTEPIQFMTFPESLIDREIHGYKYGRYGGLNPTWNAIVGPPILPANSQTAWNKNIHLNWRQTIIDEWEGCLDPGPYFVGLEGIRAQAALHASFPSQRRGSFLIRIRDCLRCFSVLCLRRWTLSVSVSGRKNVDLNKGWFFWG